MHSPRELAENGHAARQRWEKIRETNGRLSHLEGQRTHQNLQFHVGKPRVMFHSKAHLEQMIKDLIQEAERWDLEPKPASLWWTSTYDSEEMMDLLIDTKTGRHRTPFVFVFKKKKTSRNCLEEGMQMATETWWRDVKCLEE